MELIEINKKFYSVPTTWNELSQKQLLDIMDVLFVQKMSSEKSVLKMLQVLCNMTYFQFYKADVAEMTEYFYLLEDLLKKKNELTKNIFPDYNGLCGPADCINNLIMEEFVFSEDFYMQWRENDDEQMLNSLVSVLYRKPKKNYDYVRNPDGDPRQPFNENISSFMASHVIKKWGTNIKLAIATWYDGCRTKLVEDNPEVFSEGGEALQYGLISIIRSVAKNGVLGDFNQVEKKYVNLVMIELNESITEGKNLEKQMKQHG